ncbi:uncharacterized protein LOC100369234 [Saccoglossus kowalevskii]|uniref:Uncharacterized protein LOC100369234 isoform X1 n=1 Tax=Saccoglossus kowalevskii TaxID=10224 RepID=A0ABM0GUX5_SACKO|nr:PREDICTED: uncharacterized protein LOC100369234 isoform X1 [Saccoglossus kowalevskii]
MDTDMELSKPTSSDVMGDAVHFTKNKSLIIKAVDRYKELSKSDAYQQMFHEKADPTKPDVVKAMADIHIHFTKKALEDVGVELSQIPDDAMVDHIAVMNFANDPEVIGKLNGMIEAPERLMPHLKPRVALGDKVPEDVEVVSIETGKRIPLLELRINKERPLLIIASSLS